MLKKFGGLAGVQSGPSSVMPPPPPKEESKTDVMDLLDKYSSENTQYSAEETNNLLKTSLSQILNDTNNYKSVSFYG